MINGCATISVCRLEFFHINNIEAIIIINRKFIHIFPISMKGDVAYTVANKCIFLPISYYINFAF
ncbi:hypothetical protein KOXY103107_16825 [Komagataeibacter xylinus]